MINFDWDILRFSRHISTRKPLQLHILKPDTMLFEIAWEVCNPIGGIGTLVRSKAAAMLDHFGDDYFLIGPYMHEPARMEFREMGETGNRTLDQTISQLQNSGFGIRVGYWILEDCRPRVILIEPHISHELLNAIKTNLWDSYSVPLHQADELLNQVLVFGEVVRMLLTRFIERIPYQLDVLAHFHDWTTTSGLPELIDTKTRIATLYSAHSTTLGRYLAPNEQDYFNNIPGFDTYQKARSYGIEAQTRLERLAVEKAQVLISNSEQTALECRHFLGREPDAVIHNGISKRPGTGHEAFEEHLHHRKALDDFIKSYFTLAHPFKTDKTLYFFTSGRYEYRNKGFDLTLEAMARLNDLLKKQHSEWNVVLFVISKRPYHHVRPEVLENRKRYQDLSKICKEISSRMGPRIFSSVTGSAGHRLPDLNELVDAEMLTTWKQAIAGFRQTGSPAISTHQLVYDDEITQFCHLAGLDNTPEQKVKVVYHPDVIERARSVFGLDFKEFTRGCHLGIFPSLYEPWGNTVMETAMQGTPVISSNASGFGRFMEANRHAFHELRIVDRKGQSYGEAAQQLTDMLLYFVQQVQRDQFVPRTSIPRDTMNALCWTELFGRYFDNYRLALMRYQPVANLY